MFRVEARRACAADAVPGGDCPKGSMQHVRSAAGRAASCHDAESNRPSAADTNTCAINDQVSFTDHPGQCPDIYVHSGWPHPGRGQPCSDGKPHWRENPMTKPVFVIVGASLAGAKAAEELRTGGFDGQVILIGAEPERPYERPPLTKGYLRSESEREEAYVHPDDFYARHEIELVTGVTVTAIEPGQSRVTLDGGRTLGYDKLLLTTGAHPRRLEVPGAGLDGVYYLRTLADCDLLRERLEAGGRVAVAGAGWIGSEFAASARQCGLEVTVIDPQALPNERIFGSEIGAFYGDLHAQHGVTMLLGDRVASFEGNGTITRVRTSGGRSVECDFAVAGIGVVPRTGLAKEAGLETGNGIAVDANLQTSAPDIFAAGDVANAWHPSYRRPVRVEHWANALHQGPAAARAMLGQPVSYDHIPYFFSDQYDVGMEYSGYAPHWDEVVFRGDREGGEFIAFWLRDARVVAGMNVNVWDVNEQVQALIRSRQPVAAAALADPDIPLDSLASEPAART
jgi:3-phenylpropionate/trans-cinnamate dioxygenase ferredoxin reductase subunit